jgi:hypothetical protein
MMFLVLLRFLFAGDPVTTCACSPTCRCHLDLCLKVTSLQVSGNVRGQEGPEGRAVLERVGVNQDLEISTSGRDLEPRSASPSPSTPLSPAQRFKMERASALQSFNVNLD